MNQTATTEKLRPVSTANATDGSAPRLRSGQASLTNHDREVKRLGVLKTYKLYIGGKFPRTESGRYYRHTDHNGKTIANICRSSRKDFRDAVVAARNTLGKWTAATAYNRGQILYRLAEMMDGRKAQFIEELTLQDSSRQDAEAETSAAIDRLVYYAGWCDKYQQIFGTVNPVATSHFNFSVPEPTGVVSILAPEESGLLGLVSVVAPVVAGANTCVALASRSKPLCAISLAEAINDSDMPPGVVNLLTGFASELYGHFSSHKDVNAIVYCGSDEKVISEIQSNATDNVKRTVFRRETNWLSPEAQGPYQILDTQEIKTTWHPIEEIG